MPINCVAGIQFYCNQHRHHFIDLFLDGLALVGPIVFGLGQEQIACVAMKFDPIITSPLRNVTATSSHRIK